MTFDDIVEKLKKENYRITPKRKAIIGLLCANQQNLLTVDDLLSLCKKDHNGINATTIYRNIELLDRLQLIYKMNIDPSTTAYKLKCYENHHHHLICLTCGKFIPIDYCPITPSLNHLMDSMDFTLQEHSLELYGYCHACKK